MSIADKLTMVAENVQKVYDAGYAKGVSEGGDSHYDEFWDSCQDFGNRSDYRYAFGGAGWTDKTFKPKYDIRPTQANNMFNTSKMTDIKKSLADAGVKVDFSQCTDFTHWFSACQSSTFGEINTVSANSLQYLFAQRNNLVYIDKIILREDGSQTGMAVGFQELRELVEVRFEGKFGQTVSFARSTKLSKASITSIINALSATTSDMSITLPKTAVNNAFGIDVDDETTWGEGTEYYNLRHSKDNWTISYV